MGRSTKRAILARKMAAAALTFAPGSPSPRAALVELVGALREGWEMSAAEALLVLSAGDDPEAEALIMLTTGVSLDPLPPPQDAHAALAAHPPWADGSGTPPPGTPADERLRLLISVFGSVRFAGSRRRAFRWMVENRMHPFSGLLKQVTDIEL